MVSTNRAAAGLKEKKEISPNRGCGGWGNSVGRLQQLQVVGLESHSVGLDEGRLLGLLGRVGLITVRFAVAWQ
ncbi:hypothetical protein HPP92_015022 [Vanilla planifolia]|uniref:Uncharacterized protein n=1 Tax=Vanilla planifolia TaxID=51239 RepID=A0A835QH32_VANPL|nr:hypothetical protein HPP92_015022 [Vanilla planifolia]